jgi:hypothetical protein
MTMTERLIKTRYVKAKKKYTCEAIGKSINIGEQYICQIFINADNSGFEIKRFCLDVEDELWINILFLKFNKKIKEFLEYFIKLF